MDKAGQMDRRGFLRGAARAGAGVALFHIVPSWGQDRPAPSNRIVMGAIGVGGQGTGNMGQFLGMPDVQFVGVCDVDSNNAARAKKMIDERYGNQDCRAYGDYRELLARGDLDAVSMATPDHWHAVTAIAAARAGCDMYGEKPLTHSLGEGRALVDAFNQYGRVWQTGSWQRSTDNFYQGALRVRNGRLGKVVRIEVGLPTGGKCGPVTYKDPPPNLNYDMWVGPSRYKPYCDKRTHWDWRWQLDFGGGQMMDWIGHHGDIAHWGMGWDNTGPVSIEGAGVYPDEGIWDAAMTYSFTATYADGTEMIVANAHGDHRMGTKWIGENGHWIWVDRGNQDSYPKNLLTDPVSPSEIQLIRSNNHFRNFIDCVKTRQATITPAETAHRSASIGHLGQIAMLLGRKLKWDPAAETFAGDPTATRMLNPALRAPWHL